MALGIYYMLVKNISKTSLILVNQNAAYIPNLHGHPETINLVAKEKKIVHGRIFWFVTLSL